MRPNRIALILLLLGLTGILAGVAFKLNHLMGAEPIFNIGVVLSILGLLLWVVDVLRSTKK